MNATVLITGASKGIGKEFATLFASKRHNLVLVALEQDLLENLSHKLANQYQISVLPIVEDLAKPNAAKQIFAITNTQNIEVSILINNAGFGTKGNFCEIDFNHTQNTMAVNMQALTELIKIFADPMISKGYGKILNVASTAAFQPGPGMAVYFASKAYVLSLSEALTEEFRGTGVTVTALCPGPTVTSFAETAELNNSFIHSGVIPLWHPKDVAEYGYKVMMQGRRVATVGLINKFFRLMASTTPKSWVMRTLKKLHNQ